MKNTKFTQEQLKVFSNLRSVILCLQAHPDNEEHSEFADRISDLEEIVDDRLFMLFKQMNEQEERIKELEEMLVRVRKSVDWGYSCWGNDQGFILSEEIDSLINKGK